MESKPSLDSFGNKCWYDSVNKFELHRENDLPAVEYQNGSKSWYKNGVLHRENGPAMIDTTMKIYSAHYYWFINGTQYNDYNINEMPLSSYFAYVKWKLNVNVT